MPRRRPFSPATITSAAGLCIVVLAYLDWLTGIHVRIYPLYFLPLGLAAARVTLRNAVMLAVWAAIGWTVSNYVIESPGHSPATMVTNSLAQLTAFQVIVVLVNRLQRRATQEHRLARIDALTELPNARGFYELAAAELARQQRHPRPLTVAYLDLDDFKRVNEELGHLGADDLLREVAHSLRRALRASDTVARLGGDEFAMLLPETGKDAAEALGQRIREQVQVVARERPFPVTFSFGLVTFERPPGDFEQVIRIADHLMYDVKAAGKDGFRSIYLAPGDVEQLTRQAM